MSIIEILKNIYINSAALLPDFPFGRFGFEEDFILDVVDFDLVCFKVFGVEGFEAEWFGRLRLKLGEYDRIRGLMIKLGVNWSN